MVQGSRKEAVRSIPLRVTDDTYPNPHVRRFLTTALVCRSEKEVTDAQSSLMLLFHENVDEHAGYSRFPRPTHMLAGYP